MSDEHLFISDLRKHPDGEVRLYSSDGRLVSGTYARQVTDSIDAMRRSVEAEALVRVAKALEGNASIFDDSPMELPIKTMLLNCAETLHEQVAKIGGTP